MINDELKKGQENKNSLSNDDTRQPNQTIDLEQSTYPGINNYSNEEDGISILRDSIENDEQVSILRDSIENDEQVSILRDSIENDDQVSILRDSIENDDQVSILRDSIESDEQVSVLRDSIVNDEQISVLKKSFEQDMSISTAPYKKRPKTILEQTIYPDELHFNLDMALKSAIHEDRLCDVMRLIKEHGLANVSACLKPDVELGYKLLKQLTLAAHKKDNSNELLVEYGNLVGQIMLNPAIMDERYLNQDTFASIRLLVEANEPKVIVKRESILHDVFSLKLAALYAKSRINREGKKSSLNDVVENTLDLQLFRDLVLTPNLLTQETKKELLENLPYEAHGVSLFYEFDFEQLKDRSWGDLNLVEKIAHCTKEIFLQTTLSHTLDMKGESTIKYNGKPVDELDSFELEGQMSVHGLLQLQIAVDDYISMSHEKPSPAFSRAADTIEKLKFDLVGDFQKTSYHLESDVACYNLNVPEHLVTCMIGDKYFFKNNRGGRRRTDGKLAPAGIEIFEIPEDQRADMIQYLNTIKGEELSYQAFERLSSKFKCKHLHTIFTKKQSVGNCTFVSNKLLLLSLCYYQHLEDNAYCHETALELATNDYAQFVDFTKQNAVRRYCALSDSPNKALIERAPKAFKTDRFRLQQSFMTDSKPGQALDRTILVDYTRKKLLKNTNRKIVIQSDEVNPDANTNETKRKTRFER